MVTFAFRRDVRRSDGSYDWRLGDSDLTLYRWVLDGRRQWCVTSAQHHMHNWLHETGLDSRGFASRDQARAAVAAEHAACPMPRSEDVTGAGPRLRRVRAGLHTSADGRYEARRVDDGWELSDLRLADPDTPQVASSLYPTIEICQFEIDLMHALLSSEQDHRPKLLGAGAGVPT